MPDKKTNQLADPEGYAKAIKEGLFINEGSVWDIRIHLQHSANKYTDSELMDEIKREEATRNRATVVNMIWAIVDKRLKQAVLNRVKSLKHD